MMERIKSGIKGRFITETVQRIKTTELMAERDQCDWFWKVLMKNQFRVPILNHVKGFHRKFHDLFKELLYIIWIQQAKLQDEVLQLGDLSTSVTKKGMNWQKKRIKIYWRWHKEQQWFPFQIIDEVILILRTMYKFLHCVLNFRFCQHWARKKKTFFFLLSLPLPYPSMVICIVLKKLFLEFS